MEYSGNVQFWKLLERLMAAAGGPVYALHQGLHEQGLKIDQVKRSDVQRLLRRRGYGFGILFDVYRALRDIGVAANRKLLFLRDPRDMLLACYRSFISASGEEVEAAPASFAEFLQSPVVERVAARYRRFAELYRREPNVRLLRYEHALSGWHEITADIVAALQLPIDPLTAAAIARDAPAIGARLPEQDHPNCGSLPSTANVLRGNEVADMETQFADVLAAFGYVARMPNSEPALAGIGPRLGPISAPDPVLLARLRPNSSTEMKVLGRRVIMDVDAEGCRPVIGQPATGERTLAAFGCSFTYGLAIAAEETFCSLLQGMFPAWRVENHGVPAYSQTRNLIQLERETRWSKPEFVTFCWIAHHLSRNVADLSWVKVTSELMLRSPVNQVQRPFPRAILDADGNLQIQSVRVPRKEFLALDLSDFATDPHYLDQVCFRLFERANSIVAGYGGHFFVTTLRGRLSTWLAGRLAEAGIPVVDASLSGNEYHCMPGDGHPNALANRIYAERIRDYLLRYTADHPASEPAAGS
jgi:hypothetical protein